MPKTIAGSPDIKLAVDPKLASKIPPLTDDEFKQLEENILEAGTVFTPIAAWNGTIVDGHNRWKVIQNHPEVSWSYTEMDFADDWAAFEWMYKNQLGRRNLSRQQWKFTAGKLLEAKQHTRGGDRKSADFSKHQNDALKTNGKTSKILAKELGVTFNTLERAKNFAEGVEVLRSVDSEAANIVLGGKASVSDTTIQSVPKMQPEEVEELVETILNPPTKEEKEKQKRERRVLTDEEKEDRYTFKRIANELTDLDREITYTVNDLVEELEAGAESYVSSVEIMLTRIHEDMMTDENKPKIREELDRIIKKIEKVRNTLC